MPVTCVIPRAWPIDGAASASWWIATWALLALGVGLFAWRAIPAITGRGWRARPRSEAPHLRPPGQRLSDIVGPLPVLLLGIGALQRDWAWYLVAAIVLAGWLGATLVVGFLRERADPALPKTTADIVEPPTRAPGDDAPPVGRP